jgi:signal transduction histidine kinase
VNAAEAMDGEGDLTIKTALSEDGRVIAIQFTDTGCGIGEDEIERLFEPFFTTKEVGHGTGLGLAVSFGIIDRHEGTIEVRSELGVGTTFIVRLPRLSPSVESQV